MGAGNKLCDEGGRFIGRLLSAAETSPYSSSPQRRRRYRPRHVRPSLQRRGGEWKYNLPLESQLQRRSWERREIRSGARVAVHARGKGAIRVPRGEAQSVLA